jgi:hypothetical protein
VQKTGKSRKIRRSRRTTNVKLKSFPMLLPRLTDPEMGVRIYLECFYLESHFSTKMYLPRKFLPRNYLPRNYLPRMFLPRNQTGFT